MTFARHKTLFALMLALSLVIAACSNPLDDSSESDDAESDSTVEEPAESDSDDEEVETPETDETDGTEESDEADSTEESDSEATPDDAGASDDATPESTETDEDTDSTPVETATEDSGEATPESDETASGEPDADEILQNAAERAEELETAKFELNGTGTLDVDEVGEVSLSEASGAVERPDRAQIDVQIDADAAEIPLTIVSIEDQVYFTDVFTGEWQEAPDEFQFDPAIIFDEDQGIPALIRTVEEAEVLGTEEIDGRQAYQVYGVVDQETIQSGTSDIFQPEGDVDFNVWIDQETSDVLQVRAEDPTEQSDSVWEMRIFEHDEPVEIDDPEADS